jgi:RHS repeat-associated protein
MTGCNRSPAITGSPPPSNTTAIPTAWSRKGPAARRFTSTLGTWRLSGGTRIVTKLEISPTGEGYGPGAKNLKEVAQYFYHQDHLGSTGFVTDATGEVYQHLEYFPFGETWVDEVSDDLRVPYRFTGQEFDQETRLYYYGARYYDPKTSVWQSPDRILGEYLNGKPSHGVFEPRNLALNSYAHQNPAVLRDADGNWVPLILGAIWLVDKGMAAYDAYQDYKAIQSGEKTVGDVALERGTGYALGAIMPGGGLATKLGGKLLKKVEKGGDDLLY